MIVFIPFSYKKITYHEKAEYEQEERNYEKKLVLDAVQKCDGAAESSANLRLKNSIIRDLKSVIPEKEKTDSCCVVVSLSEIRAVRSLSPSDYMVKTQVELITEALMGCRSAEKMQAVVQELVKTGTISNGNRILPISSPVWSVLRRYSRPETRPTKIG